MQANLERGCSLSPSDSTDLVGLTGVHDVRTVCVMQMQKKTMD